MDLSTELKVIFLNIDLGKEFTGIESSAMIRGRIFDHHLNLPSQFLSLNFNPQARDHLARFRQLGLASPRMKMVNMFDWFQDAVDDDASWRAAVYAPPHASVLSPVEGTRHDQRLFKQGEIQAYLKHDDSQGHLLFVNYLRQGKIWKRDWFGRQATVVRSEFVDPSYDTADAIFEYFWGQDGQPVLLREYAFDQDKHRSLRSIQRLQQGHVTHGFERHDELVESFLHEVLDLSKINVLVLDRSTEYFEAATRLRAKYPDRVKLIGMVHNTHYVHGAKQPGDPMLSDISSFYKAMLVSPESCDALVFLTEAQRRDVTARFGPGRYHVIPHAVPEAQAPADQARDLHRIVVPGRFAEEKQNHLAIQAFRTVRDQVPDATLHFYGYGDKRGLIEQTIDTLGLQDAVFLHDFDPDVASLYRGAGLTLGSSRNEGFSISLMQAIHNGCPAVSFDCNYGPGSLIRDQVNGFLCKPQDVEDLAAKVCKVLLDRPLHQQLIDQCPGSLVDFSEAHVATLWARLLQTLVPGAVAA